MVKAISGVACLSLLLFSESAAQFTVRGTVVEADGRTGVSGAVVKVERRDALVGRALTAESGAFTVPVRDSGLYTVRAQRIGFKPVAVEAIANGASTNPVVVRMAEHIETLSLVRVVREERCGSDIQRTPTLQALWLEAVKALEATAVAGHEGRNPSAVNRYIRELRADGRTAVAESTWTEIRGARAYRSVPASVLAATGYVANVGDEYIYYAPDIHVLISESFLATHCFAMDTRSADNANRLGVRFRPSASVSRVDIEGVLWLDPGSYELQELEYSYTRVPYGLRDRRIGGLVRFDRAANGRWFVTRWVIRMPLVAAIKRPPDVVYSVLVEHRLVGFREEGAVIDWGGSVTVRSGRETAELTDSATTGAVVAAPTGVPPLPSIPAEPAPARSVSETASPTRASRERPASRRSSLLTAEEIAASRGPTALEVIRELRPAWLAPRYASVNIYVDGLPAQGWSALRDIATSSVAHIELLSASEATMRFGTSRGSGAMAVTGTAQGNGALVVTLRR